MRPYGHSVGSTELALDARDRAFHGGPPVRPPLYPPYHIKKALKSQPQDVVCGTKANR